MLQVWAQWNITKLYFNDIIRTYNSIPDLYISGYPHEATRNDRDDYISVDYDQLEFAANEFHDSNLVNKYRKCNSSEAVQQRTLWWCKMLIGTYDTRSISHYPSKINDHYSFY